MIIKLPLTGWPSDVFENIDRVLPELLGEKKKGVIGWTGDFVSLQEKEEFAIPLYMAYDMENINEVVGHLKKKYPHFEVCGEDGACADSFVYILYLLNNPE